ncbi:DNA double-strand break repair Rad50 ATPase [Spiroplasma endosymbiont of Danaus chrysippus]|nr:DNA double-strand break repair Rad50 ATPase [Spiroplasma endosymbiont of Danaus chrysippus]
MTDKLKAVNENIYTLEVESKETDKDIKNRNLDKVDNRRTLERIRNELFNLKEIIQESSFFNGSLKALKENMTKLQEEKTKILNLKKEILKKEELKVELQSLENLIALIKQKSEIELEIERLEKNKEQLTTDIDANKGQIQSILNDNESSKEQLITKIDEINLNIKTLNDNIDAKTNLISCLEKEIKSNEENISLKLKDLENIFQNIIVLQDWRDSIWRRVISLLTFGIFCNYKSVQKKLDKEFVNRSNINKEITDLWMANEKKIKQEKDLFNEILKNKKETNILKENWLVLETQLSKIVLRKEIEDFKVTNSQKQFLLENTILKIKQQREKLKNISIENMQPLNDLEILQKEKSDKLNSLNAISLDKLDKDIETLIVRESGLKIKINENKSSISDSSLDNFNIEVEIETKKQLSEVEPFTKVKPLLEKSNSNDSGIDITTESIMIRSV